MPLMVLLIVHCCFQILYGLFVEICWMFTLSNIIVLWKKCFSQKCFSNSGMTIRNLTKPTKKSEKIEFGKDRWYSQMGQVGTGWSTWDRWDRDRGVSVLGGARWDWDRGIPRLGGTG